MRKPELKRITDALKQLTPIQRKAVSAELAAMDAQPASTVVIEGRFAAAVSCAYCDSEHVRRHGSVKGLQRYFCAQCRRTFSGLDRHAFEPVAPARQVVGSGRSTAGWSDAASSSQ